MLDDLLSNIQNFTKQNLKSLVVFDLDSTLFDVSPRLERILLDFAADPKYQKLFPEQIALFKNIKTLSSDWGITGALERVGLDGHHPEFQKAVMDYWQTHFFSNHYLEYDRPMEGALDFVTAVLDAGADVAYLTGRDIARMGIGSEKVLRKWGLSLNERSQLVLKPHKSLDDAEYKTDWFVEIRKRAYKKVYFFDNEPVILHRMQEKCPEVECFFFDSTHSGKAHPPDYLPRVMNFLRKSRAQGQ